MGVGVRGVVQRPAVCGSAFVKYTVCAVSIPGALIGSPIPYTSGTSRRTSSKRAGSHPGGSRKSRCIVIVMFVGTDLQIIRRCAKYSITAIKGVEPLIAWVGNLVIPAGGNLSYCGKCRGNSRR